MGFLNYLQNEPSSESPTDGEAIKELGKLKETYILVILQNKIIDEQREMITSLCSELTSTIKAFELVSKFTQEDEALVDKERYRLQFSQIRDQAEAARSEAIQHEEILMGLYNESFKQAKSIWPDLGTKNGNPTS